MIFSYDGAFMPPNVGGLIETVENHFWFAQREHQVYFPVAIGGATRDSGNSVTTVLRSGLLLGKVTSTGKLKEWNPTGTDGSQIIFGILDLSLGMQRMGNDQDRFIGHVMVRGMLKADFLLIPGQSSFGIVGNAYEHIIRAQLNQRGFMFSDSVEKPNLFGGWRDIQAKTDAYSVLASDNGTLFTNRGAAGAVTFTLPATAYKGLRFGFYVVADQTVTITAGTADTMVSFNDAAADSVAFSTSAEKVGNFVEVIGDGTNWLTMVHLAAETATPTVAT